MLLILFVAPFPPPSSSGRADRAQVFPRHRLETPYLKPLRGSTALERSKGLRCPPTGPGLQPSSDMDPRDAHFIASIVFVAVFEDAKGCADLLGDLNGRVLVARFSFVRFFSRKCLTVGSSRASDVVLMDGPDVSIKHVILFIDARALLY
ncbi:hypothetical protein K491DRAFT_291660 [Lophiostoma macrostomum CBS 122681]|uniref:FHA domain-containing protein n=1 Tax=Lophiostoma macrostomum CBS 122681 TaxID=1314788 RepID=A0A6A6SIU0_9PLEO|nr:hypothetical protein K491DRAFT_291660 [Lophiostoma macrostomum CBS 122681]